MITQLSSSSRRLPLEGLKYPFSQEPWRDADGLRTEPFQPLSESLGNHLGIIIRADVLWNVMGLHRVSRHIDRVSGADTPCRVDRQALAGVFIDHHHRREGAAVIGPVEHRVPEPHTVGSLSGRNKMQELSLSHSRLRFGCCDGTSSSSRRQIRITRPWLTCHPCDSSKAWIRR